MNRIAWHGRGAVAVALLLACAARGVGQTTAGVQAPAGSPNLAANSSFEDGHDAAGAPDGWAWSCTGGSSGDWVTGHAHTGQHCAHITKVRDGVSHVASVTRVIRVPAGSELTLSGWAHARTRSGDALLFLYMYTANNEWIGITGNAQAPAGDEFQPISVTVKLDPRC